MLIQVDFPSNTSTKEMVKISFKGINIFAGATQTTGGQVSGLKTKWYILDFIWYSTVNWS